jgi:hypothetical protein
MDAYWHPFLVPLLVVRVERGEGSGGAVCPSRVGEY